MNLKSLFRTKNIAQILQEGSDHANANQGMNKTLKLRDLTAMGVAAVIGAGIFSTIGDAAYQGGPGSIFLFLLTAITCGFTAFCYAEFASRVPVSGSAYTYSYVAFGELVAWIIGWALILEYAIGNVVVALSWSSYFTNLLDGIGVHLPAWLTTDPESAKIAFDEALKTGKATDALAWTTAPMIGGWHCIVNFPAFMVVVFVTVLAYIGIQESKRSANFMVALKLVVLTVVIGVGIFYIKAENYIPFMPNGMEGVLKGVSAVFFAYIGFDAISTTAEECENPQRDLPRGMIYSLIICTIIYIATALVITGMVRSSEFHDIKDPLAFVFDRVGLNRLGYVISISAVVAATSVLLVFQIGQPRIWMSMSRDGLLPKAFAKVHPKYQTPSFATIVTGFLVAIPTLVVKSAIVVDLTSIGTLFAFFLVCGGVLTLPRHTETGANSRFRLPYLNGRYVITPLFIVFLYYFGERFLNAFTHLGTEKHEEILFLIFMLLAIGVTFFTILRQWSAIPVLGMLCCAYLMIEIPVNSWFVFFGWMGLGLALYFSYGFWHSKLGKKTA